MRMSEMLDFRALAPDHSSTGLVRLIERPDTALAPGGIVLVNRTGWAVVRPTQRLQRTAARGHALGGADGYARVRLVRTASAAQPPYVEAQGWVPHTWSGRARPHRINNPTVARHRSVDELATQLDQISDPALRALCIATARSAGAALLHEGASAWGGRWSVSGGWAARLARVLQQLGRGQAGPPESRLALMQAATVLTDRPVPFSGSAKSRRTTLLRIVADEPELARKAAACGVTDLAKHRLCALVRKVASAGVAGTLRGARLDPPLLSALEAAGGSSFPGPQT